MCELNTNVSKITFTPVIIAVIAATILSPSVVTNTFAKSSDGDSGGGGSNGDNGGGGDKSKTSEGKKGDGGHLAVPGSPAVPADNKPKNNGGGLIVPGSPAVTGDSASNDANSGYNNNNIKKFDTSKSSFRIGGSDGKVVEYKPGFNETFYNSTLPYCFAVQSGNCFNSATGQIIP